MATTASSSSSRQDVEQGVVAPRKSWSLHEASPLLSPTSRSERPGHKLQHKQKDDDDETEKPRRNLRSRDQDAPRKGNLVLYLIYAMVNVIIAVPGLYGTWSIKQTEIHFS